VFDLLFGGAAAVFSLAAFIGTGVFAVRVLAMLKHGYFRSHLDRLAEHGKDASPVRGAPTDFERLLARLPWHTISGGAMGFGWFGLFAYSGFEWPFVVSFFIGAMGSGGAAWAASRVLGEVNRLRPSGPIPVQSILGRDAEVAVAIPPLGQGRGKVRMVFNNEVTLLTAISDGEPVAQKCRVRVVRVNGDETVTVSAEAANKAVAA